ncbi:MAG: FecR domain-containing protein [Bacteroidota bacterium]
MAEDFTKDDLLGRWLGGTLSDAEERELRARPDFAEYEQLVRQVDELGKPAFDAQAALARQKALRKANHESNVLGEDAGAKKGKKAKLRRLSPLTWGGVAAACLLIFSLAWWSLSNAESYYEAALGTTELAGFSDGSSARLNAGSNLTFATTEDSRTVDLRGEAFFDVVQDGRTFTVSTLLGEVTVLGTSFNVYSREQTMLVTCQTGQVQVTFTDQDGSYTLAPGQSVALEANGAVSEGTTSSNEAFDWLRGQSVFRERPLNEVFTELERQFDLQIEVPANLDLQRLVSTTFPNNGVEDALDIALSPLEFLTYTHEGQNVVIRMK